MLIPESAQTCGPPALVQVPLGNADTVPGAAVYKLGSAVRLVSAFVFKRKIFFLILFFKVQETVKAQWKSTEVKILWRIAEEFGFDSKRFSARQQSQKQCETGLI